MVKMAGVKHVVGIADLKVSADADDTLITYALGSCLGITVHDAVARVGGMLHVMLPQSSIDAQKGRDRPWMFVDTGVPELFREAYKIGARKERLVLKVAGGAASREDADSFQIGKRNILMLRQLLWKNGVLITAHDVGGQISRTVSLAVGSGEVRVKTSSVEAIL